MTADDITTLSPDLEAEQLRLRLLREQALRTLSPPASNASPSSAIQAASTDSPPPLPLSELSATTPPSQLAAGRKRKAEEVESNAPQRQEPVLQEVTPPLGLDVEPARSVADAAPASAPGPRLSNQKARMLELLQRKMAAKRKAKVEVAETPPPDLSGVDAAGTSTRPQGTETASSSSANGQAIQTPTPTQLATIETEAPSTDACPSTSQEGAPNTESPAQAGAADGATAQPSPATPITPNPEEPPPKVKKTGPRIDAAKIQRALDNVRQAVAMSAPPPPPSPPPVFPSGPVPELTVGHLGKGFRRIGTFGATTKTTAYPVTAASTTATVSIPSAAEAPIAKSTGAAPPGPPPPPPPGASGVPSGPAPGPPPPPPPSFAAPTALRPASAVSPPMGSGAASFPSSDLLVEILVNARLAEKEKELERLRVQAEAASGAGFSSSIPAAARPAASYAGGPPLSSPVYGPAAHVYAAPGGYGGAPSGAAQGHGAYRAPYTTSHAGVTETYDPLSAPRIDLSYSHSGVISPTAHGAPVTSSTLGAAANYGAPGYRPGYNPQPGYAPQTYAGYAQPQAPGAAGGYHYGYHPGPQQAYPRHSYPPR